MKKNEGYIRGQIRRVSEPHRPQEVIPTVTALAGAGAGATAAAAVSHYTLKKEEFESFFAEDCAFPN